MTETNGEQPKIAENHAGGSGGFSIQDTGRADTKLLEIAVENRWPIPEEFREQIVRRQVAIAINPQSSPREATSAARCLQSMAKDNQDLILKLLDKVVPDQHEVAMANEELRQLLGELRQDDSYVEEQYARARLHNGQSGQPSDGD